VEENLLAMGKTQHYVDVCRAAAFTMSQMLCMHQVAKSVSDATTVAVAAAAEDVMLKMSVTMIAVHCRATGDDVNEMSNNAIMFADYGVESAEATLAVLKKGGK